MIIKQFPRPIAFLVFCLLPTLAPAQTTGDPVGARFANGIAAIVEDRIITVGDIRREIEPLLPQIRSQSRTEAEFRKNLEQVEDDIIQNLTDQTLIVKDFYSDEKRRIPESFVENEVQERLITQFDSDRSKFLEYLNSIGKTPREYRDIVREEIIVGYMRSQLRKSQSIVSPVKIENYYKENQERFYQGDSVHLRLIRLTQLADEDSAVLEQSADTIIDQLGKGAKFEDLATQYSQDTRRNQGGDWGWINREDLKPELADVAFSLEKGAFSQPIRTEKDIFILFVEDKRDAGVQPISEVRDQIERILISQMSRDAQERYLERLRRDGYVRYFN
ncbi:MAG: peptidylprolyl isomerase [Opitutaceae bacterium]